MICTLCRSKVDVQGKLRHASRCRPHRRPSVGRTAYIYLFDASLSRSGQRLGRVARPSSARVYLIVSVATDQGKDNNRLVADSLFSKNHSFRLYSATHHT